MIPLASTLEQKKFPVVTATIILVNVVVFPLTPFLFFASEGNDKLFLFGPGSLNPVGLFTSLFLHQTFFHMVFNMMYLWAFGTPVEQRIGKERFLLYYLGAGFAGNILETGFHLFVNPADRSLGLGASGAISGVLALYVCRCWFLKMKMVLFPRWLPFGIIIQAARVIFLFWFFQYVIYAATTPLTQHRIGYLAQIGGFFFGLVISLAKRYGHEGMVEYYSEKVGSELTAGYGWKDVQSDENLLKLAREAPDDPAPRMKLAQYYAAKRETAKASAAYRDVISWQFSTNPLFGAFTVLEHYDALGIACPLEHHVRAAGVFAEYPDYLPQAQRVIETVLGSATDGAMAEMAHILHLKICQEAGDKDRVAQGVEKFKELFPRSSNLSAVAEIPAMKSGTIFNRKKLAMPESRVWTVDGEEKVSKSSAWAAREIHRFNMEMIASPLFIFVWLVLYIALRFLFFGGAHPIDELLNQFCSFFFASAVFRFRRWAQSEWSWRHMVTEKQEEQARAAADLATLKNKAAMSDRCEDFQKAAELYEKVLAQDPGDIQARFRLAKIYQQKLKVRESEIRHFKVLQAQLPRDHPYRHEAEQAIGIS